MARDARRSTLVDIAAEAGVSVSAVSKVLNGRTDVAAGTRARIAGLLRQHGYQVASRLGFGVVDLLIANLHSPWAEELLRGTVEAADEVGVSVVVSTVRLTRRSSPGWLDRAHGPGHRRRAVRPAPAGQPGAAAAGRGPDPAGADRPARGAGRRHPVRRHHQLAGRHDRDPAPDRARPPPDRDHRRPGAPLVEPGPAGRVPRRPAGGRAAARPRSWSAGDDFCARRRPPRGRAPARPAASRPPRSWPATTARRSACCRRSASAGCARPDDLSVVGFDDVPWRRGPPRR